MAGTNQLRQLFESAHTRKVFAKGELVVMQGNTVEEAYLINSGIIRVIDFQENGEQHTLALLTKNHIFPFSWLLTRPSNLNAHYYYQAMTEVDCYIANIAHLKDLVGNNAEIAWALVDIVGKSYFNALSRLQNLQKTNVQEKVDFMIYYLAILLGKNQENNKIEIDSIFTHQEIADLAGLTRESVSRQLKKDKYDKIIYRENGKIFIDVNKLDIDSMPKLFKVGA
jgi:CRP/FNR family cyclic AMP-dependent transcriptional regulator